MSNVNNLSAIWSRLTDLEIEKGEGAYVYDTSGKRYLDFTSGIAVTSTGHCHPRIVETLKRQSEKLIFGQLNTVYHPVVLDLIEELKSVVPPALDMFFFSNSGAEAVEGAVKLAKHATRKQNIIVFQGSFHGRTHLAMSMTTSKTGYRKCYQPLIPGIFATPYPYAFYYGWSEEETLRFALKELEKLLVSQSAPEETACIVVEPILGEGGYVVPPKGFLPALRKICTENDILLIADEIQCGCGRSGTFFAVEHENVEPDIMTMAKGLGSGMPISCAAYKKKLGEQWITGSHGGTYGGGNTLSCAAAAETIRIIKDEKLTENAVRRGEQLMEGLTKLQTKYPGIGDVRGRGLMVSAEFTKDGKPDGGAAKEITGKTWKNGLLLLTCGTYGNIIRWMPPLIVTEQQVTEALDIFEEVLKSQ